jgi:arsenate reductase (thioredoxin)
VSQRVYNVLFLCTHNSSRSILAEAILNHLAQGRFKGFSAGSSPTGKVNPFALETLKKAGIEALGLRSKSWNEFAHPGAPQMDIVITVCDNAANEVCPIWPGQPIGAHWGLVDPSSVRGDDETKKAAFSKTYREIIQRLQVLLAIPVEDLDRNILLKRLNEIGADL